MARSIKYLALELPESVSPPEDSLSPPSTPPSLASAPPTPPTAPTPPPPPTSPTPSSSSSLSTMSSPPLTPTPSPPSTPSRASTPVISPTSSSPPTPSPPPASPTPSRPSSPSTPTTSLSPSPPTKPTPTLCSPATASALVTPSTSKDNPREIRNKAEKQRRDKLNRSIADLASMVPPVVAASRKIDKTGVLRLTAHYLRAHEYVFGDSLAQVAKQQFKSSSMRAVLGLFNGILVTVTYKGIIVVVSENVQQYLGYTELELLGHNILSITHKEDHEMLMKQIMPKKEFLGPNGELLIPDEPDGTMKITEALAREKRKFVLRLKKLGQRSEPNQYLRCHVEGSFRKSDKACVGPNRCCQVVRRARARSENHCTSGNDVVFIGVVRPEAETFLTEIGLESSRMEYRTRHSIDGEIIQCEQRIALVTGYLIHEVQGVNAMNFMHKDDVLWVIMALREMYDQHRLYGESCYRLMTKNGEFIYMKTRGRLDVDKDSRVVTSFVCTNTVVDETEGKYLIKMMKKKYNMKTKKEGELLKLMDKEEADKKDPPVEDPRHLEKVILHLVTNLPSQDEVNVANKAAICGASTSRRLAIIPPKKERIVSAIEKMYSVMTFPKVHPQEELLTVIDEEIKQEEYLNTPSTSQGSVKVTELSSNDGSSITESELDKITELDDMYMQKLLENSVQMPTTSVCMEPQYTDFDLMTQPIEPTEYSVMTPHEVDDYLNGNFFYPSANQSAVELKYEVLIAPQIMKNEIVTQADEDNSQVALPSSSKSSLKRSNECMERNIFKKKLSNMSNDSDDDSPDDDFSCLEALFDEEMLDKQIESTIKSLEKSIGPTFPDLLISNEVEEILKEIENGQNKYMAGV